MHPSPEATHSNLYRLLCLMENSDPRKADSLPPEYRGDFRVIGACYLGFLRRGPASLEKETFQRQLRVFFRDRARELYHKAATIHDLQQRYNHLEGAAPLPPLPGGLEETISVLVQRGNYEAIGRAVRRGAYKYHQRYTQRQRMNIAEEFDAIAAALERAKEG